MQFPDAAMSDFFKRQCFEAQPTPLPRTIVQLGAMRFTLLTSRLVRMEYAPGGEFDDRGTYAFPHRRAAEPPDLETENQDNRLTLKTSGLELHVIDDGRAFHAGNLSAKFVCGGRIARWQPGMKNTGNLGGTRRTLDQTWRAIDVGEGILSIDGWALVDDTAGFRLSAEGWPEPPLQGDERQDWYLFAYGHDFDRALADFAQFSGATPLIPRFALGAWWSRWWPYSTKDYKELVKQFDRHGFPLDVMVLDMDWHTQESWTGYTWNRQLLPDPPALLSWLHEHGLKTTLNLHPAEGVQHHEAAYEQVARTLGQDPAKKTPVPFRIDDPAYMRQYFEALHHPLERDGVDFWWIDWQQGETSAMAGLDPLHWLNHMHFMDHRHPRRRGLIFSRWPGLGGHRYPVGFSGDTASVWAALAFQLRFTAASVGVGAYWWSHDIGGHFGEASPELYTRWVQFGALSPCLRLHSSRQAEASRAPWKYGEEALVASRAAFELRYRLLPYLYTLAWESNARNLGPCRPMTYSHPERPVARLANGQYWLGDQLIAAPIAQPARRQAGPATTDVWLPDGNWIDTQTLESFIGPRWVRLSGGLSRLPLLAKAGALVPETIGAIRRTRELDPTHLALSIYPGGDGRFSLYEDDGETEAWRRGEGSVTTMELTWLRSEATLVIGASEGNYEGMPQRRRWSLRWHGLRRPTTVHAEANGKPLAHQAHYDEQTLEFRVELAEIDARSAVALTVRAGEGMLSALTAERNLKHQREDVRDLLGPAYEELLNKDELITPEWVAAIDDPAALDGVARLGGPLARMESRSEVRRANETLGELLVAAPADGNFIEGTVEWTLKRRGEPLTETQTIALTAEDSICTCPWTLSSLSDAPGQLHATVAIEWRGFTLRQAFSGSPLWPSVPCWHMTVESPDHPLDAKSLTAPDGEPNPELAWHYFARDTAHEENAAEWFCPPWPPEFWEAHREQDKPVVWALSRLQVPSARQARLVYMDPESQLGPVRECTFWLNGTPLELNVNRRECEVELHEGTNVLCARLQSASFQYFTMGLFDTDGRLMSDVAFT